MRKVFLDDLPRWENGGYKGKIKWKETIGYKIKFIYDDIEGELEILDYVSKSQKVKIKYKSNEFYLNTGSLMGCAIGIVIGQIKKEYMYDVGEIVEDITSGKLEIIEQIKMKKNKRKYKIRGYKYKCLICGNEDMVNEIDLKNKRGCNVCCNPSQKVLKGYNDLWTTHPEVAKLLTDKDIGYRVTHGSNKQYEFKCQVCEHTKNMNVCTIVRYGLSCPRCSDGISYPEKFMMNFLNQLNIKYETQKIFNWSRSIECDSKLLSGNKKYDFYIPSMNCIIETHGNQHYENKNQFERSLEEEEENDKLKEQLAIENGIEKYVIIDCRKSELEWIKESIISSSLNELFNLSNIDWTRCNEFARNSRVKEVANLYNSGVTSTYTIAEILKLERSTVSKNYLKQAVEIGWCDYDPKVSQRESGLKSSKTKKKKVIQLTENDDFIKEWESARDAYNDLNICYKKISSVCNGKMKTAGGYKWIFKKDYEDYRLTGRLMFNDKRGKNKEVICLNTLETFKNLTSAGRSVDRAANNIRANILGKTNSCGVNKETGEPQQWMFKEDYEKLKEESNAETNFLHI